MTILGETDFMSENKISRYELLKLEVLFFHRYIKIVQKVEASEVLKANPEAFAASTLSVIGRARLCTDLVAPKHPKMY